MTGSASDPATELLTSSQSAPLSSTAGSSVARTLLGRDFGLLGARVRANILRQAVGRRAHIGSALSIVEILTTLYFGFAEISANQIHDPKRDRVILSKGHGALALYAILYELGLIDASTLFGGQHAEARLPSLLSPNIPGVELGSGGSLGHGLAVAAGIAIAANLDRLNFRTIVIMGDGELNEGSVWEAALFASHRKLRRLIAVVDRNGLQIEGATEDILAIEPLVDKWRAFGWRTLTVDGHEPEALLHAFKDADDGSDPRPVAIIAKTVKGKGVSFMEGSLAWHMAYLSEEDYARALSEMERRKNV